MKKLLLLPVMMLLIYCNDNKKADSATASDTANAVTAPVAVDTVAQDDVLEEVAETPIDPISAIRGHVEYINTVKLEKKHYEFMCDEKMMVDYFYNYGELVKIAVDFGTVGDTYAKEDYYYDKGKLVFNYEFVEGGPACEGCIKTNEYRTYVQDDKPIKHLKNKTEEPCTKCDFSAKSKQYRLFFKAKTEDEVKAILCR